MDFVTILVLTIVTLFTVVYLYLKKALNYWQSRNVPCKKPSWPRRKRIHHSKLTKDIYDELKGKDKFCGMYFLHKPFAVLLDPDLIKHILIKDFNNFVDRGVFSNEKDDPLSGNLFSLSGNRWRNLRAKLSPTFTSGKMKFMYPTIIEVANRFKEHLSKLVGESADLEIKDLLARFTTDIIGTCAFGIECNSLEDPNAEFRKMGAKAFELKHSPIVMGLMNIFLPLAKLFRMTVTRDDVSSFFMKVVNETIEYREKNNVKRNDFMDILLKLKNEDQVNRLTVNEIAAQAFIFFLAGFETSSTTMTYCLYELVMNPDIQAKARQEIRNVLRKHDGKFNYEAMMDMHYVDQLLNETLRKYPPLGNLFRITKEDYPVPGTDHVLEKDTRVWIPVHAIHHDPEYYPDPEMFDPERFSPKEVAKRDPILWLPFGDGPRNCVGLRFGMMQARVGLVMLLNNFEFFRCTKTPLALEFKYDSFILTIAGGLYLKLKKIPSEFSV